MRTRCLHIFPSPAHFSLLLRLCFFRFQVVLKGIGDYLFADEVDELADCLKGRRVLIGGEVGEQQFEESLFQFGAVFNFVTLELDRTFGLVVEDSSLKCG